MFRFYLIAALAAVSFLSTSISVADEVDPELIRQIVAETLAQTPQTSEPIFVRDDDWFSSPPEFNEGCYFNVEFMFLKPRLEDATGGELFVFQNGVLRNARPEFHHELSPRFEAGYEGNAGTGIRFTAWLLDHETSLSLFDDDVMPGTDSVQSSLVMRTFDLELTQRCEWSEWQFLGGAGIRYAKLKRHVVEFDFFTPGGPNAFDIEDSEFEGWGPTVGLEARRTFNDFGITAIVAGRASWLAGDVNFRELTYDDFGINDNDVLNESEDIPVIEVQIGLEYAVQTILGEVTAGALVEYQHWKRAGSLLHGESDDSQEFDLSLLGFGFMIGVHR